MNDATRTTGYVKLMRTQLVFELLRTRPTAFLLLTLIALRTKRTDGLVFDDLIIGEALIGDYYRYRTTEQRYRSDKRFLEKYKLATFKPTTKGTRARLASTDIFDVNIQQSTDGETGKRRKGNENPTTNNNDKNEKKNVRKYSFSQTSEKRKSNPILEDPTFRRYVNVYSGSDDASVRAKMGLLPLLENRYPAWRYEREWEEAREYLRRGGL